MVSADEGRWLKREESFGGFYKDRYRARSEQPDLDTDDESSVCGGLILEEE